jgi:hypothetical protein
VAQFLRRNPAPPLKRKDYRLFRLAVREDFHETCAYCLLSERWAAGVENFELDHFRPRAVFPQLLLNYYNLYWSCHVCNRIKHALWPSPALQQRGIGHGQAPLVIEKRQTVLNAAYLVHPERFVKRPPKSPQAPAHAWINKPQTPVDDTQ